MFKRETDNGKSNEKIVEWLAAELKGGENPERLKRVLKQQDVDPKLVDRAIKKMESKKEKPKGVKKIYFLAFILLVVISAGIFLVFISNKPSCGNDICEAGENCYDCPQDCKCDEREYCSAEEKRCLKPTCGDGKCNYGECSACPDDCSLGDCCGRENCNEEVGENCSNCPQDCGSCPITFICGNKICEGEENCYDCPQDCKCIGDEYCSVEEKRCLKPTCGDGKCEPYEGPDNCCLDCHCTIPGEICNKESKKCEQQEVGISDERALELAIEYFENQNREVKSFEVLGVSIFEDKLIKQIKFQILGEEWFSYVGVTEDGEVIELPIL